MTLRKILADWVALLAAVAGARYLGSPQHAHAAFDNTDSDTFYSPILAGEELPDGYRRSLPRDATRPIYDPTFVSAWRVDWVDDTLIVGFEINGDARAYPVSYMNQREIANDHVGGTPVLVTLSPPRGTKASRTNSQYGPTPLTRSRAIEDLVEGVGIEALNELAACLPPVPSPWRPSR